MKQVTFQWHEVSEVPDMNEPVIVLTGNNRIQTFKDTKISKQEFIDGKYKTIGYFSGWSSYYHKYNAKYWAYQKDLVYE